MNLTYMLVICGSSKSQASNTCLSFAQNILPLGHRILQIFLYGRGVQLADLAESRYIQSAWIDFANENSLNLSVCSNFAIKNSILNNNSELKPPFIFAGLGDFVHGMMSADRFIVFG